MSNTQPVRFRAYDGERLLGSVVVDMEAFGERHWHPTPHAPFYCATQATIEVAEKGTLRRVTVQPFLDIPELERDMPFVDGIVQRQEPVAPGDRIDLTFPSPAFTLS